LQRYTATLRTNHNIKATQASPNDISEPHAGTLPSSLHLLSSHPRSGSQLDSVKGKQLGNGVDASGGFPLHVFMVMVMVMVMVMSLAHHAMLVMVFRMVTIVTIVIMVMGMVATTLQCAFAVAAVAVAVVWLPMRGPSHVSAMCMCTGGQQKESGCPKQHYEQGARALGSREQRVACVYGGGKDRTGERTRKLKKKQRKSNETPHVDHGPPSRTLVEMKQ
jgi:hypothetical protein